MSDDLDVFCAAHGYLTAHHFTRDALRPVQHPVSCACCLAIGSSVQLFNSTYLFLACTYPFTTLQSFAQPLSFFSTNALWRSQTHEYHRRLHDDS
jgi:hypothetical protein